MTLAPVLLLLAAPAAPQAAVPDAPPEPSPWVTGLGELLGPGTHITVTRDRREGMPTGPCCVRAVTAAEAAALRAEARPYRGRLEELTNARARLEAESRRELRTGPADTNFELIEQVQTRLMVLRRELERAQRIVAAADALRTVVACENGRLTYRSLAPPDPAEGPPPAGPAPPSDTADDAPAPADPSVTARDVVHQPLGDVVQVSESPARFAERTGAAPPVSDFSDPEASVPAAPFEDE